MLLLDLPTELLLRIFFFLGPEYFRSDLHRLTIASTWYTAAVEVLSGYFYHAWDGPPSAFIISNSACERLKSKLRTARLGSRDRGRTLLHLRDPDDQRRPSLRSTFKQLIDFLEKCRQLRSLDLCINWIHDYPDTTDFFEHQSLFPLLSLSNLTSLVLSYQYRHIGNVDTRTIPGKHLCSAANALFPTLRRFFYRMPTICQHLLDLDRYPELPAMEEMIISLNHPDVCECGCQTMMSLECVPPGEKPDEVVKPKQFEDLARKFAHRMPNAKVLLITSGPSEYMLYPTVRAYDALNDREYTWTERGPRRGALWCHRKLRKHLPLKYYEERLQTPNLEKWEVAYTDTDEDSDEDAEESDELTEDSDEDAEESLEDGEEDVEDDADSADGTSQ